MLKSRRLTGAVVGSLLVASGTLSSVGGAAAQAAPKTVTVAINNYENNLTPFSTGGLAFDLTNLVYDSLYWSQARLDPEPWLAESAEPSPDRAVWTVRLRPGLKWHDGRPLTADDVAFTYDYFRQKRPPGRWGHHVFQIPPYQGAEVVDPLTVRLRFGAPAPTFTILPGGDLPILPKHVWETVDQPAAFTEAVPVGSGPFKVVEMVSDQRYVLEANPDYFKGKPLVDRLVLPVVREPSSAFAALRTGQVDSVFRPLPPELVEPLRQQRDLRVVRATRFESVQIHFKTFAGPLADPRLRRAISLAINRDDLVRTVLLGEGDPGRGGFYHPESPWATPGGKAEFDPAQAERVLDEAGLRRGPDGIRTTPDGAPLRFSLLVSSVEPLQLRAAQITAEQVAAIGVTLTPETIDPTTLQQRRGAGNFDAFVAGLETHAHTDPDAFYFFFSQGITGPTFGGYKNPRFDALAVEASRTTDLERRKGMIGELQRIFAEEVPTAVLFYPRTNFAYRTAAYDQWFVDPGHGIFNKRSFLPGYGKAQSAGASAEAGGGGGAPWPLILGIGLGAVVVAAVVIARRRSHEEQFE